MKRSDIYYKIAITSFFVFMFFEFFGTSAPFSPRIEDVENISQENVVNQLVYSSLFLISLFSLFHKRNEFLLLIKKEKILTLFLLWCVISMAWSVDPFVTFKRFFRILTLFTITISLLIHTSSTKEILNIIKPILYFYVFISFVSCLVVPGALDPEFRTWRGLTDQKNDLGQISVICSLLSFFIFQREEGYNKLLAVFSIMLSVLLLVGSRSMTSISSFLFLVMIGTLLSVDKIFKPIGMKKTFSTITIVLACILFLSVIFLNSNLIASVANLAGKDLTFTGRTFLWASMLQEISNHILLGTGFQAFWSLSNPSVRILYETFNWLPNQSHNGYIDIMNEVGLVGFILFISMIVNYFLNNIKLIRPNPWKWLIIIALIINLQESSFFRAGHLVGGMLVFAYLILFQQLRNEEEYEGDNEKIEGKPKSENELIHSNH